MITVKRKTNAKATASLQRLTRQFADRELQVGWFNTARYDDDKNTPVAAVAARNEFGDTSKNIPPRPFMRPTVKREESKWKKFIGAQSKAVLAGATTATKSLSQLGLSASGEIARSISEVHSPPLSRKTIRDRVAQRAKSGAKKPLGNLTKPLVNFGIMIKSVTFSVR